MKKFLLVFAIFSIFLVAGCTSTSTPAVAIASPTEGQVLEGNTVTVMLSVSNIKLAAPNGTVVEGEGHFHVWLDGANEQRGPKTTFVFNDVQLGEHTIKVELHKGDHSLYEGTAKTTSFMLVVSGQLPPVSTVAVKEFNMTAKRFEFNPSTITVNRGDQVVLHITSLDVEHGFALTAYNIHETLPPGVMKTISFTATEVGEFSFFCSVFCGSGHGEMRGKLVVNP